MMKKYCSILAFFTSGFLSFAPSFVLAQPSEMMPMQQGKIIPVENKEYIDYLNHFDHQQYRIDAEQFFEKIQDPGWLILDLRTKEAYDRGHIKGAKHLGSDIDIKILFNIEPNKQRHILLYCSNSLYPTRMLSLTDMSLPQMHALGYRSTYKAGSLYQAEQGGMIDVIEKLREMEMWVM